MASIRSLLLMTVAFLSVCASVGFAVPDAALWETLDIVPMPREIELTGRELPMAGAVLVLGSEPTRQDEIGAQWIRDQVVKLGGEAPEMTQAGQASEAALRIIIGTRDSNPMIEAAAQAGEVKVGPNQPGEKGYVIASRRAGEATEILLAGADNIGALYACVTLGELMFARDGNALVREAKVTDWPDFQHFILGSARTGGTMVPELVGLIANLRSASEISEQARDRYLSAIREHYDRLLRWKVSALWYREFYIDSTRYKRITPQACALFKEGIQYGKERGIGALFYAMAPFAGLVEEHPEYDGPSLQNPRWKEWIRCWSLDEMRAQTAEDLAQFCADMGVTDVGFHDTDTGGFLSPAQWNDRCERCRERWGDDFAAATAHKHQIYYDALKKHAPEVRVHFTLYPYNIRIFTQEGAEEYIASKYGPGPGVTDAARKLREKWEVFWRRVTEMLPPDVTFCIRETGQENVDTYRKLIGDRGVFTWWASFTRGWDTFFEEHPRYLGTFYGGSRDFMFPMTSESFLPIEGLATVEYAWNVKAPGAAPFQRLGGEEQWKHGEPVGEIYEVILPHVVRNLFGRQVDDEIIGALSENVSVGQIFAEKLAALSSFERMSWQVDRARQAMALLDQAWAKREGPDDKLGMDGYAFRRFVYLREVLHSCRWMAEARAQNLRARELGREGKLAEARGAVEAGRTAVEDGRQDGEALLAERPDDPVYEAKGVTRYSRLFRQYTPGMELDWDLALKELEQTEKELPGLVAAGGVPEEILKRLSERRMVQAGRAAGEITVDGRLDEASWGTVYPSESFFVYKEDRKIASAHTTVRLLCDEDNLYVGGSCWVPDGGRPVAQERERDEALMEDDILEVFLVPPQMNGEYVHLMINAAGSLYDAKGSPVRTDEGMTTYKRDASWDAADLELATVQREGRWDVEVRISLADLGSDAVGPGWKANFGRESMSANDTREISSIQAAEHKDFHDLSKYRAVTFTPPDFIAPPPQAEIEVAGLQAETKTLPDRVATVCKFGVRVSSARVLHEVKLSAELYDAEGKLHYRGPLAEQQAILYVWEPRDAFEVGFLNPVESGGIRLILESEETTVERWVRIGGWPGTNEVGAVLSDDTGIDGSGALAGACAFPSMVTVAGQEEQVSVFNPRAGTIELWLRPEWSGRRGELSRSFDMWEPGHGILHFGPVRPQHPYTVNYSSVLIDNHDASTLRFAVYTPNYAGWGTYGSLDTIEGWGPDRWYHVAAVWEADAEPEDWLRIYVDGKRISGATAVNKPERMGEDTSVRVHVKEPYAVQLGSLTNGRRAVRAEIDELRISGVARYDADFEPPAGPFAADGQTTALLHFDGDLSGLGRSADGTEYSIEAAAGPVAYH